MEHAHTLLRPESFQKRVCTAPGSNLIRQTVSFVRVHKVAGKPAGLGKPKFSSLTIAEKVLRKQELLNVLDGAPFHDDANVDDEDGVDDNIPCDNSTVITPIITRFKVGALVEVRIPPKERLHDDVCYVTATVLKVLNIPGKVYLVSYCKNKPDASSLLCDVLLKMFVPDDTDLYIKPIDTTSSLAAMNTFYRDVVYITEDVKSTLGSLDLLKDKSLYFKKYKRFRIGMSRLHEVCAMREGTDPTKLVTKLLSDHDELDHIASIAHGMKNEAQAGKDFLQLVKTTLISLTSSLLPSRSVVDVALPFLISTPDFTLSMHTGSNTQVLFPTQYPAPNNNMTNYETIDVLPNTLLDILVQVKSPSRLVDDKTNLFKMKCMADCLDLLSDIFCRDELGIITLKHSSQYYDQVIGMYPNDFFWR